MNPKITDWHKRRVWLLGASTGIGAALARELARRGARLALSSRSAEALAELDMADALLLPCDATDETSLRDAHTRLLAQWDHIDLAIYMAGDYQPMRAENFVLASAERVIEINFNGAMRFASVNLPHLQAGTGIAFVASVAGYRGLPKALCYGPGKAALIHFAECLYIDLAPRNIGVWCINPGFVKTRLTDKNEFAMPALLTPEQAAQAIVKGFAAGAFEISFPTRFILVMKLLSLLPYRIYFWLVRQFIRPPPLQTLRNEKHR